MTEFEEKMLKQAKEQTSRINIITLILFSMLGFVGVIAWKVI
ncbi:hypothetical protein NB550_11470 [Vibrio parahaemolyticus]|jgi:predicted negative regulator of RcsB-dependent stress response|nr:MULTISPECIES: hypothetical protein [Vibrio harveyi group]MCR9888180.1 hypothetical protein [Vibrio parahaemolyticus]MCR9918110.1 hypothetical protein [Vibrio parahaemolyticus]MDF5359989.1 hypothetical protein [Vibrio parahaemolyticus]MDG2754322.1 hypothetical protein [Vibrio parahaemolyticus]MDG2763805.1 hypothetical protein [Vibrio parahaemolyticus]